MIVQANRSLDPHDIDAALPQQLSQRLLNLKLTLERTFSLDKYRSYLVAVMLDFFLIDISQTISTEQGRSSEHASNVFHIVSTSLMGIPLYRALEVELLDTFHYLLVLLFSRLVDKTDNDSVR
jgi:hypothetical protein